MDGKKTKNRFERLFLAMVGFLLAISLSGCTGTNGSGLASVKSTTGSETTETPQTLSGKLQMPIGVNPNLMADMKARGISSVRGALTDPAPSLSENLRQNGRAVVNGYPCPITFNATSTDFLIAEVAPSNTLYRVEIIAGKIGFKAHTKQTSNLIIDAETTAAVLLAERLGISAAAVMASSEANVTAIARKLESMYSSNAASLTEYALQTSEITTTVESQAQAFLTGKSPVQPPPTLASSTQTASGTTTASDTPTTPTASSTIKAPPVPLEPIVYISSPAGGAKIVAGTDLVITAVASNTGSQIQRIEFFQGSVKIGERFQTPFTFTWSQVPAGTHTLSIQTVDTAGNTITSDDVSIEAVPPADSGSTEEVSIWSPDTGTVFDYGQDVPIYAIFGGDITAAGKIDLYADTTKIGDMSILDDSFLWKKPATGTYVITAKYPKSGGIAAVSKPVTITVRQTTNKPPTVTLASPSADITIAAGADLSITALASDPENNITQVDFFQGTGLLLKLGTVAHSPYTYTWAHIATGTYYLSARVTDAGGETAMSQTIKITAAPPAPVAPANAEPTVTILAPAEGQSFIPGQTIVISAAASDSDGTISKVEFFNGSSKIGEKTSAPYLFSWTNAPAGTLMLTAKATDNGGAVKTAIGVQITVQTP